MMGDGICYTSITSTITKHFDLRFACVKDLHCDIYHIFLHAKYIGHFLYIKKIILFIHHNCNKQ